MTITAETIRELREAIALDAEREPTTGFKYHSITIGMVMNRITDLLDALEAERAKSKEYRALVQRIMGECETNMSRCRLNEKRAIEDCHDSERWHQDGRWHGNNDILDYAERGLAKLPTEGKRDE